VFIEQCVPSEGNYGGCVLSNVYLLKGTMEGVYWSMCTFWREIRRVCTEECVPSEGNYRGCVLNNVCLLKGKI